jgi:hypothetical protein
MAILYVVICLSVTVGILLILILICVIIKKNNSKKDNSETQSSTGSSDVERPFMPQNSHILIKNNNKASMPLPPPPMTLQQWSNAIHPGNNNPKYSDSGFNDHDNSKESGVNQYEVPYAHLLRPNRPQEDIYFTQEAFLQPQNSLASGYYSSHQRGGPVYNSRPPLKLRYFSDYDSQ